MSLARLSVRSSDDLGVTRASVGNARRSVRRARRILPIVVQRLDTAAGNVAQQEGVILRPNQFGSAVQGPAADLACGLVGGLVVVPGAWRLFETGAILRLQVT